MERFIRYWGSEDFVPRGHCGDWGWWEEISICANSVTFLAYMLISWECYRFAKAKWKEMDLGTQTAFIGFAVFVWSCGVGHAWDVFAFWHAPYRTITLWQCVVAGVSAPVAMLSPYLVRKLSEMRGIKPDKRPKT